MCCPCKRHDSDCAYGQAVRRHPPQSVRGLVLAAALSLTLPGAGFAATLTDSAQRTVEVPANVARVVPAGAPAQVLLEALAPGKLAGVVEGFKPEHAIYVDPALVKLQQIPQLTRTDAPGDVAEVKALNPSLVLDYGNVSARFVAADEKIQTELGVPTLIYGGRLAQVGDVVRTLGEALDVRPRAAAIASVAANVLERAMPYAALTDADRVPVYAARGQDGLLAMRGGTSLDEPIRLAGGRNVVVASGGTFQRMSVEAAVALKPKVVIFGEEEALSSPLRKALPADTIIVLDAGEPYKAVTGPPSLNRLVGLAALPGILHPDKAKADPEIAARVEADLFPPPPGVALPAPLQVR